MADAKVIHVDLKGLPEVKKALEDLFSPATSARMMSVVAGGMLSQTLQRFRAGKDPDGTPWKPTGRGGTILVDSGGKGLMGSVVSSSTATGAAVGTNKKYARIHQFGGPIVADPGKALAIPFSDQAKRLARVGLGPRDFPSELDVAWPRGKSRGWLVETKAGRKGGGKWGKNSKSVFHYALVKRVTIPKRPFLGVGAGDARELLRRLEEWRKKSG